jgi:hypothetical protein
MRDDVELRRARTIAILTGTWLALLAAAGPGSLLRTKVPEGWGVPAGAGARALVRVEGVLDGERCAALREAVGRLRAFGVEGMVGAGGCRTVWPEWANREGEGVHATVVDGAGVIRYEGRWPVTVAGMRAMGGTPYHSSRVILIGTGHSLQWGILPQAPWDLAHSGRLVAPGRLRPPR